MCGIVGYFGKRPAKDFLIEGLKRLEYRGYDSAGVAFLEKGAQRGSKASKRWKIKAIKALGKVAALQMKMEGVFVSGIGIAHTRWATHGKPSERNAHPHIDCKGLVAVVHNGIIENHRELKEVLEKRGHKFRSETDTEVIAHLLEEEMSPSGEKRKVGFEEAFVKTLKQLRGAYGIVAIATEDPEIMLAARFSSPLVLGIGSGEMFIASDVSALVGDVKRVVYLDDDEIAVIRRDGYVVKTLSSRKREKEELTLEWDKTVAEHSGYAHFMLKEIFDQPKSFADALRGRLILEEGMAQLGGLSAVEKRLRSINRIVIVSCGTSYHSGLVGEYMFEEYAGIPTEVEMASEFRYRKPLLDRKTAVIAISQSGETADTLAAIREAKEKGALVLGIVNVVGSTIARETDAGVYCHAGPEISVASTKAFTSQLAILSLLTLYLGRQRGLSLVMGKRIAKELEQIPKYMERVLAQAKDIKKLAKKYAKQAHYLYLGRKYNFPNALEGALKIKEIAYAPAQGYPTGEMKHGPIALIDSSVVTVMIMPKDSVYEKNVSGMEEILARGGKILAIATEGDTALAKKATDVIFIPKTLEMLSPLLAVIPLQLFAYYVAVERGYDIDKPRNLAKSVTVE
ncbi:MAG: glutamine--fructose-6-phosphate aminotransferase [Candidatus Moranbacteria bacterium RIFCSPLOWO2_12_FULL_48_12]|nr:MAG: glutamine--fructose-6-phosphate aminotransferase [Candidatus Moranbacteria bacterium RIFCSPLOWO2_12_FULL_48_12]